MQPFLYQIAYKAVAIVVEINMSKMKFFATLQDPSLCIHINGDILGPVHHVIVLSPIKKQNGRIEDKVNFRVVLVKIVLITS